MKVNYDVVIFGAGPVGITCAATLKALNRKLNICVLDKRPESTRNHGLNIRADSVAKIQEVLDQALKSSDPFVDQKSIKELQKIFQNWKNHFIRTSTIETDLAKQAGLMGIHVLRGSEYGIKAEEFETLLDPSPAPHPLTDNQKRIKDLLLDAQVLIGADGSHSDARKGIMGKKITNPNTHQTVIEDQLRDKETLQYLIELKYQTNGKAVPREIFEASMELSKCGHFDVESMNKNQNQATKPVTLHIFVDKDTFDRFRQKDHQGNLKGVFGNSWSLKEIQDLAKTDEKVKKVYLNFKKHLKGIQARGGSCEQEQISTLEMSIYRSEESVKQYKGKSVLLMGDANSGMVLERGFNKGLKEAALGAQAVSNYFKENEGSAPSDKIPHLFTVYQEKVRQIFEEEKWWAHFKNSWIKAAQLILSFIANKIFSWFIKN